jgi:cytochrome c-type biogenesis protein CcmE
MDSAIGERTLAKIVVTVLVGLGSAMVFYEVSPGDPPYKMVDELVDDDEGTQLRVHGYVMAGSIAEDGRTFVLQKNGRKLRVRTVGQRDKWLRDQAELVVTGTLLDGELQASRVNGKCATDWRDSRRLDAKFE